MPKTAALMKERPASSDIANMTNEELAQAVALLQEDLPGNPIGFINQVGPESVRNECGSVHLQVTDTRLDEPTYTSLMRLLATPFGDIVQEHFRRQEGWNSIRFGWEGLEGRAPQFMAAVNSLDIKRTNAADIPHDDLRLIIEALHQDLPEVMQRIDQAAQSGQSAFIPPEAGDEGKANWFELTAQLMFVFATPLSGYVVEWCKREFSFNIGAVNCCAIVLGTDTKDKNQWSRQLLSTQIGQQLTPDC